MNPSPVMEPTGTDWWLNLTQGSVAALIGLAGAYFGFRLTKRHEDERMRRQAAADYADHQAARLDEAVNVSNAAAFLIRDVRLAPFFGVQAITELLAATLRFVRVARKPHPEVAEWALTQYGLLGAAQAQC